MSELKVTEIYHSIQGESLFTGWPCVFIRLSGCPLRCRWCDTVYSFDGGKTMSDDLIVKETLGYDCKMVELTGGEPLAQAGTPGLAAKLINNGLKVLIETGGSESIGVMPKECHIIMDIKPPSSGMTDKMHWDNINHLKPTDEIKFVIGSKGDFEWTSNLIAERQLDKVCSLSISPAFGLVTNKDLVEWQLESKLNIRLNLQIHKFIWHPRKKGV